MKTEWMPESGEQVIPCDRRGVNIGNVPQIYIGKSTINMDFPYVCEGKYGEYDSYAIVKPYDEKFVKLSKIYEKAKSELVLYQKAIKAKEVDWFPKKGEQVLICDAEGIPYEIPEVYLGKIANYVGDKTFYLCQTELDDYFIYTYAEISQYDAKLVKLIQAEKKAKKELELHEEKKKTNISDWIPKAGDKVIPYNKEGVIVDHIAKTFLYIEKDNTEFPYICENEYGAYEGYAMVKPYDEVEQTNFYQLAEKARKAEIAYKKFCQLVEIVKEARIKYKTESDELKKMEN